MEPQIPTPQSMENGENFVSPLSTPEQLNKLAKSTKPEQAPASHERVEQKTGAGVGDTPTAPTLPPPLPIMQPVVKNDATGQVATPVDDNPLAADDIDVIEKEWVVRAKQIVSQTKNDPYQQEHEVSKLQADYLRKRFGVEVKLPQE